MKCARAGWWPSRWTPYVSRQMRQVTIALKIGESGVQSSERSHFIDFGSAQAWLNHAFTWWESLKALPHRLCLGRRNEPCGWKSPVTPVVFIFQRKSTIANLMCNQWEFVPGRWLHSLCRLLCWVMWVVQCGPIKCIYKFLTCNGRQIFHEIRDSPCVHTQPTSMSAMLLVLMSWHMAECTIDLFKLAIGSKGTLNFIK